MQFPYLPIVLVDFALHSVQNDGSVQVGAFGRIEQRYTRSQASGKGLAKGGKLQCGIGRVRASFGRFDDGGTVAKADYLATIGFADRFA